MSRMSGMTAEIAWDPGAIADGQWEGKTVTVPGAKLGDFAFASFTQDQAKMTLVSYVSAADTVLCYFNNWSGGATNLSNGILRVKVVPFTDI